MDWVVTVENRSGGLPQQETDNYSGLFAWTGAVARMIRQPLAWFSFFLFLTSFSDNSAVERM
jgi:hypothetical protein